TSLTMPAPKWATFDDASVRDSVSSRTCPPIRAASSSATDGAKQAATRSGSPRPQSMAKGMPQTLPEGVVIGVLKSPWASNQALDDARAAERRRPLLHARKVAAERRR